MERRKFTNHFKTYIETGKIDKDPDVNSTTFINMGTSIATINNSFPLPTGTPIGGTLVIEGNENEIDDTIYSVQFEGGTGNLCVISKKFI